MTDTELLDELEARIAAFTGDGDKALACIAELEAWARARITECRRQESLLGVDHCSRVERPSRAFIEAQQERRTLQAVLGMLGRGKP